MDTSINNLEFPKYANGEYGWRITTKVAGKTIIVAGSTEGFSSKSKALGNMNDTRDRLNKLTEADVEAAYTAPSPEA